MAEVTITPAQFLEIIGRQAFADWYNDGGRFDRFITGEDEPGKGPSEGDILADIRRFFESVRGRA